MASKTKTSKHNKKSKEPVQNTDEEVARAVLADDSSILQDLNSVGEEEKRRR
jgi:hypothetical protein